MVMAALNSHHDKNEAQPLLSPITPSSSQPQPPAITTQQSQPVVPLAFGSPTVPPAAPATSTATASNSKWSNALLPFLFPALGGLLFGYDIGATSGALLSLKDPILSDTSWYDLSSSETGLVVSGSLAGALLGCIAAFYLADPLGRRRELLLASSFFFVGACLMALAPSLSVLLLGRLMFGGGIGLAMHAAPMYIAETSPPDIRGTLISLKEAFIVGGILLGYLLSSLIIDQPSAWRLIYGATAPISLLLAAGMAWLPPSPRWLLLRLMETGAGTGTDTVTGTDTSTGTGTGAGTGTGTDMGSASAVAVPSKRQPRQAGGGCSKGDGRGEGEGEGEGEGQGREEAGFGIGGGEAHRPLAVLVGTREWESEGNGERSGECASLKEEVVHALMRLKGGKTREEEEQVRREVEEMVKAMEEGEMQGGGGSGAKEVGWRELVTGVNGRALTVACGLVLFQQITGQPSVLYYAATILQDAGFAAASDATRVSVLLGIFKLALTGVAVLTVDRWGRRPLLLTGVAGLVASLLLLSATYQMDVTLPWLSVASLLLYVGCYQISFGPISWLMISEVFSLTVRGRAQSIATLVNFSANALVTFAFPPIEVSLGQSGTFLLFAGSGAAAWLFILLAVPETKGLSLEEIQAEMQGTGGRRGKIGRGDSHGL